MDDYNFQDLSVLVCDDSLQIRALVKNCLMAFGINNIHEASNAEAAFEALEEFNPDLVITDWNLGESCGLELVRRIRQSMEAPNPYVPIIMLTGHTDMERVETARDAGVSSFLAKPMSAQSLFKRLVTLVEDKRPFIRCTDFFGPDRRFHEGADFDGEDRRASAA
jgi:PleD family two-component response regulator